MWGSLFTVTEGVRQDGIHDIRCGLSDDHYIEYEDESLALFSEARRLKTGRSKSRLRAEEQEEEGESGT